MNGVFWALKRGYKQAERLIGLLLLHYSFYRFLPYSSLVNCDVYNGIMHADSVTQSFDQVLVATITLFKRTVRIMPWRG